MNMWMRLIAFAGTAIFGFGALGIVPAKAQDVVIHAGKLIDGIDGRARAKASILLDGERVAAVVDGFVERPGAKIVNLSQYTVLPGFIDTHVHLTSPPDPVNRLLDRLTSSEVDRALAGVVNARKTLSAGFTTVRDLSAPTASIVGLRNAIDREYVEGPRIFAAGAALGPTGGHSDGANGMDPMLSQQHWADGVIDGVESARLAVRRLKREGADLVKIMPSGGVLSVGNDPSRTLMTNEEIGTVIQTAHALGMKVAAHAHGLEAILLATRLGADSIEHGSYADAAAYDAMKEHGTYLVPTLLVADTAMKLALSNPERFAPTAAEKAIKVGPMTIANLGRAYRAGVKIAFGTDQGLAPHGENAAEFALMAKSGMSARDIILSATRNAAELLGAADDIGTIREGRFADIVAVEGDPINDVTALSRTIFVMKGGKIIRNEKEVAVR